MKSVDRPNNQTGLKLNELQQDFLSDLQKQTHKNRDRKWAIALLLCVAIKGVQ